MTTVAEDKGTVTRLPADDLAAIYDIETHYLYLYARGTWATPSQIKFVPILTPPFNQVYALEGYYDGPIVKPEEHQFVERFGPINLPPWFKTVIIWRANSPPEVTVDILHVPTPLPQEPPS
jgi:hypothetical protein